MNPVASGLPSRLSICQILLIIWLSVLWLNSGYAVSVNEVRDQVAGLAQQHEALSKEVSALSAQLTEMTRDDIPIRDRMPFANRLIKANDELEAVIEELEALRGVVANLKVDPLYRLVEISGDGKPGVFSRDIVEIDNPTALFNRDRKVIESLKLEHFPLVINPRLPFKFDIEMRKRIAFPKQGNCDLPSVDTKGTDPAFEISFNFDRSLGRWGESAPALASRERTYEAAGNFSAARLCDDAPSRQGAQAPYQKEGTLRASLHFVPAKVERQNEDRQSYYFRIETDTDGAGTIKQGSETTNQQDDGIQPIATFHDDDNRSDCLENTMTGGGFGSCWFGEITVTVKINKNSLTLRYRDVPEGEPFISSAPVYSHPGEFEDPLKIGELRFDVTVPELVGKTAKRAREMLEESDIPYQQLAAGPAPTPGDGNLVARQEPVTGTLMTLGVADIEPVKIWVWDNYQHRKVPNLVGLGYPEAKELAALGGFELKVVPNGPAPSAELSGTVAGQDPAPGTEADPGAKLELILFSDFVDVRTVPHVVGLVANQAKTIVWEAGLVASLRPGEKPEIREQAGTVQSQEPDAGSTVMQGAEVVMYLYGPYVETITVPDLQGLGYAEATNRLENAGLAIEVRQVDTRPNSRESAERVQQQNPAAGSETVRGETVQVWFYGQYTPTHEELVAGTDCSGYQGSVAYWDNAAGQPKCGCPVPLQWDLAQRTCVSQGIAHQELCSRDYPGSVFGRLESNGSITCDCPQGYIWTQGQTACVKQPSQAEQVAAADCTAYPGSVAYWDIVAASAKCGCPNTLRWDLAQRSCVTLNVAGQELCGRDYPGSIFGYLDSAGVIQCDCPQGYVWTRERTGCVLQTVQPIPNPQQCAEQIAEIKRLRGGAGRSLEEDVVAKLGVNLAALAAQSMGCDQTSIAAALGGGTDTNTDTSRGNNQGRGGCRWYWDSGSGVLGTGSFEAGYSCECDMRWAEKSMCAGIPMPPPPY